MISFNKVKNQNWKSAWKSHCPSKYVQNATHRRIFGQCSKSKCCLKLWKTYTQHISGTILVVLVIFWKLVKILLSKSYCPKKYVKNATLRGIFGLYVRKQKLLRIVKNLIRVLETNNLRQKVFFGPP